MHLSASLHHHHLQQQRHTKWNLISTLNVMCHLSICYRRCFCISCSFIWKHHSCLLGLSSSCPSALRTLCDLLCIKQMNWASLLGSQNIRSINIGRMDKRAVTGMAVHIIYSVAMGWTLFFLAVNSQVCVFRCLNHPLYFKSLRARTILSLLCWQLLTSTCWVKWIV